MNGSESRVKKKIHQTLKNTKKPKINEQVFFVGDESCNMKLDTDYG